MNQHIERARLLIGQRRFRAAQDELGLALAEESNNPIVHYFLAIVLHEQNKYEEAVEAAQNAIALEPTFAGAHTILGIIHLDRDKRIKAEQSLKDAISLDPSEVAAWGTLARLYLDQKKWDLAIQHAEKGLEFDPEDALCENVLTMALERSGRTQDAVKTSAESLRKNPDDSFTHSTHGWTTLNNGQYKEAQVHFREALRLDPNNEFAKQGMIEALNSNHLLFRLMFKWYSSMSRMTASVQWVVIIGVYLVQRILNSVARDNPALRPFVIPIIVVILLFVILSWVARPLFNTLLRFNRFGKYLLDSNQIMTSNFIAGMILLGIVTAVVGVIAVDWQQALICFSFAIFMLIPIGGTSVQQTTAAFAIMLALSIVAFLCGLTFIAFRFYGTELGGLIPIFAFLILGISILSNVLVNLAE